MLARPMMSAHDTLEPVEIRICRLPIRKAPGEIAHADSVHASFNHPFSVLFPLCFGIIGGATVRKDPLFRIIIDSEIHRFNEAFLV